MLKNDPPPGTKVRFTREFRESKGYQIGSLVRPLRKYYSESSTDEFEVEFDGKRITVQRHEIEQL